MGIEQFTKSEEEESNLFDINRSGEDVRPYVDKNTHEVIREFSMHAGLDISVAYDVIIQTVLDNDNLTIQCLEELSNGLSEYNEELLDDIAQKMEELNRFPSRGEINKDEDMYGFPIYILEIGSISRIKNELVQNYEDISSEDVY